MVCLATRLKRVREQTDLADVGRGPRLCTGSLLVIREISYLPVCFSFNYRMHTTYTVTEIYTGYRALANLALEQSAGGLL